MGTVKCLLFRHFFRHHSWSILQARWAGLSAHEPPIWAYLGRPTGRPWRQKSGLCPSCVWKGWGIMIQKVTNWCPSIIYQNLSSISFGFQPTFHPEALAWAAAGHTLGHHFRARAGNVPLLANAAANGCLSGPWPLMVPSIAWPKLHISTIFLYPLYLRLRYLYSIYIYIYKI